MTTNHGWLLTDLDKVTQTGLTVFSTFCCGGGSSMGYKRAGFTVVGANDIDPVMKQHYEANLHPPVFYLCPVKDLSTMPLPQPFFDLDILDGSPPCSTFSMSGNREKDWGREKFFREGQAAQVLDDLFFDFLDVANRLQPKVIIAENVKGMLAGSAKGYLHLIFNRLKEIGYNPQIILLNAAFCNVAQNRQRVFIIASRKDLELQPIKIMSPSLIALTIEEVVSDVVVAENNKRFLNKKTMIYKYWHRTIQGENFARAAFNATGKNSFFNSARLHKQKPSPTLMAAGNQFHWDECRYIAKEELLRLSSFPDDYKFFGKTMPTYLTGMSVPPRMMEVVASAVRDQWLMPK